MQVYLLVSNDYSFFILKAQKMLKQAKSRIISQRMINFALTN